MTIEVTPEEIGPDSVRLDEASRAELSAGGADVEQVERELHGMKAATGSSSPTSSSARVGLRVRMSASSCAGTASRLRKKRRSGSSAARP
jgi:hypothetical protein